MFKCDQYTVDASSNIPKILTSISVKYKCLFLAVSIQLGGPKSSGVLTRVVHDGLCPRDNRTGGGAGGRLLRRQITWGRIRCGRLQRRIEEELRHWRWAEHRRHHERRRRRHIRQRNMPRFQIEEIVR